MFTRPGRNAFKHEAFSFVTHAAGAAAAIVGLVFMLMEADRPLASTSLGVYGVTMIAMFTTSALHHLAHTGEGFFRRLDMSAIYLFIAGTYTPMCLLGLPIAWGLPMLLVVWLVAIAGVTFRWTLPTTPRWVTASIYLAMGWMGLAGVYPLVQYHGWLPAGLLGAGGAAYSIGAVIYARQRPDPWPHVVGHHGLWHVFVLAGASLHFAMIWGLS